MLDPAEMSDDELLDELAAARDPGEVRVLRAAAAQRGLWSAAAGLPLKVKREISEQGGGVL